MVSEFFGFRDFHKIFEVLDVWKIGKSFFTIVSGFFFLINI